VIKDVFHEYLPYDLCPDDMTSLDWYVCRMGDVYYVRASYVDHDGVVHQYYTDYHKSAYDAIKDFIERDTDSKQLCVRNG